jgi:signal peptidase I
VNPIPLDTESQSNNSFKSNLVDFIQTLVVFAAIGTAIYLFIAQPHKVSGTSMFPNFHDGDYIITDKVTYRVSPPKKGDIIVFKNPRNQTEDFIKRIIGLPGEKVKIENGHVFVNGQRLGEKYLTTDVITQGQAFLAEGEEVSVPPGEYFVLGDNRSKSSDSREWGFITKDEIIGKVFLRYWPQNAFGFYPAAAQY